MLRFDPHKSLPLPVDTAGEHVTRPLRTLNLVAIMAHLLFAAPVNALRSDTNKNITQENNSTACLYFLAEPLKTKNVLIHTVFINWPSAVR